MSIRERVAFWREFRGQLTTTGALQPSSRFLAAEMLVPLRHLRAQAAQRPLAVVEMGPGTGPMTRAIAALMRAGDRLDCYEVNADFAHYLRHRIATEEAFKNARDLIEVHHQAAQTATLEHRVDAVICSVPLNNLSGEIADEIFAAGRRVVRRDGWFSYFEYPVLPTIGRALANRQERQRIDAVAAAKARWARFRHSTGLVWRNVPPARAIHLRFEPVDSPIEPESR